MSRSAVLVVVVVDGTPNHVGYVPAASTLISALVPNVSLHA